MNSPTVAQPDLAAPPLKLRGNLRAALHENRGTPFYLIENTLHGKFFRLGCDEWQYAALLDGKRNPHEALEHLYAQKKNCQFSPDKAQALIKWLATSGLLDLGATATPKPKQPASISRTFLQLVAKFNPFYIKVPLFQPDRLIGRVLPWVKWTLTVPAFVVWMCVCLWGLISVGSRWHEFLASASVFISPHTWLSLWAVWILLKVVHEFFHGLVCKKYGGFVSDSGMAFILFSPVAYVDVTNIWKARGRWPRIFTSAAGMYVEFFIAAIAAIVWSRTDAGLVNYVCQSIVLAASITTLLFNANPLMRFDGYYMLADLLGIQNLYMSGRQYMLAWSRRFFFGLDSPLPNWERRDAIIIRTYGFLATGWKFLISASLTIGAATLFHGAGIIVAALGVVLWGAMPVLTLARYIMADHEKDIPNRGRFVRRVSLCVGALVLVCFLPWPGGVTTPAMVDYAPRTTVRSEADGFIDSVHVHDGQYVIAGTVLVTMRSAELKAEWQDIRLQVAQAEARARSYHQSDELTSYQAEQHLLRALREQEAELTKRMEGLIVKATTSGKVLEHHLDQLVGSYVEVGQDIMSIGDERSKEIHLAIPEKYLDSFSRQTNTSPTISILGSKHRIRDAKLTKVEPQASNHLRYEAWGAHKGGPLPVEPVASDDPSGGSSMRLIAPHFQGLVELSPESAETVRAGQIAKVRIGDMNETIGRRLLRSVRSWVRKKSGEV